MWRGVEDDTQVSVLNSLVNSGAIHINGKREKNMMMCLVQNILVFVK